MAFVITSYSIHYTKLYDFDFKVFNFLQAVFQRLGFGFTGALKFLSGNDVYEIGDSRITSYNVCYTKLLRQLGTSELFQGEPAGALYFL